MPADSKWEFFKGEDLARNLESGIFYFTKAFKGMPNLFKSTGKTDKRLAKKEFPRLLKAHLERYQDGRRAAGSSPTIAEVIEEIEQTESPSLRAKTQRQRSFYFKRIRDEMELGHLPIDRLNLKLWSSRLEKMQQMHKAEAERTGDRQRKTYWGYSKNANILLRYSYEQKYVSHWLTFPNPDGPREEGTVFTIEEIRQLWAVMNENTRDQFVLSYECCMRLREMLRLTWSRVDLESGEITLRAVDVKTGSKTKKGRKFIMTTQALDRLRTRKRLQDAEGGSIWVFPSRTGKGPIDDNKTAWNNAKTLVLNGDEKRGIKATPSFQHWGTWHDLRHTAITRMLVEQNMNITKVSEYVGTSITTLQKVYLHSKAEHTRGITENLRITDSK